MKPFLLPIFLCLASLASAESIPLWDLGKPVPKTDEITQLDGVRHEVIKERDPDRDGYSWLHGVALAWWGDRLYASFGLNKGKENTVTEEFGIVWSEDDGETWSEVVVLDPGTEQAAVSHGVFLAAEDALWAFQGAFEGTRKNVCMRAYRLAPNSKEWESLGVVARDHFWPMAEPVLMDNGEWILAGFQVGGPNGESGNPAAVAISRNLLDWVVVTIPAPEGSRMWGESAVIVDGATVTCIARSHRDTPVALVSVSTDYGHTWPAVTESNLPMVASKPYAGILSTGQRYLICTTTADAGNQRNPLTIAVSKPGESLFSRVYRISERLDETGGDASRPPALSYPYAVEHNGNLYVGYSNDRGLGGNRNCAELAVIPIESLKAD
ncbi:MAG: exo-alpha-sialidase [Candidatus Omnitrophica bacterium]|nr:exo-alpha-sialidase [Candidatus Omnitrophota bacterium]